MVAAWAGCSEQTAGWLRHAWIQNLPYTSSVWKVSDHDALLFSPRVPWLLQLFCCHLSFLLASICGQPCSPDSSALLFWLHLFFLEGLASASWLLPLKWAWWLQSPDTQEISSWTYTCHLTPQKTYCAQCLPTHCSPWQFPHFWGWHCDSSPCPGLKLEATFKAMQWGTKGSRLGDARGTVWIPAPLLRCHRITGNL